MHSFEVHSNESACRESGCLGMNQVSSRFFQVFNYGKLEGLMTGFGDVINDGLRIVFANQSGTVLDGYGYGIKLGIDDILKVVMMSSLRVL